MNKEMEHLYNLVQHLIISQAHVADNYQRMMQGEIPLHGSREFNELRNSMIRKIQEIEHKV